MPRRCAVAGQAKRERGVAAVEFAIVAPLLLTILFGMIEFGHVFLVRQTVQHAAREACRVAVLKSTEEPYDAPDGPVVERLTDILSTVGVTFNSGMLDVTVDDPVVDMVTLEVTVPYGDIAISGFLGPITDEIEGQCTMRKEG
jgi:hypothetical protein